MKLSPFLLFALAPLALHVPRPRFSSDVRTTTAARVAPDSVQYINSDGDTTHITTDSAAHFVKASPIQVIFLRVGSTAGVRITRKALAKISPAAITKVQIDEGQSFIMQYGDAAKPGVLTITVKGPPGQQDSSAAKTTRKRRRSGAASFQSGS